MTNKQRIIIIDDDDGNNVLSTIAILRVYENIELKIFTNSKEGIEYIEEEYEKMQLPTMLFLDINMPGLSGWDILGRLKKMKEIIEASFNIYILSSSVDRADKERADSEKLIKGYLIKPLRNNIFNLNKLSPVN
ncbi:MAG: response regulator [Sphingobacteriales bacterium JAD_PAG50586_3]|nr:MAG: response regulator [Sphingobacteriales bacterium JAD_PAG50586_3]